MSNSAMLLKYLFMKSSIKIDFIDRGTGKGIEPVIRVEQISSEDPRDTLIQTLFQSLQYSNLIQLSYMMVPPTNPPATEMQNRILLYKPERDYLKIEAIVWQLFHENISKDKKLKGVELPERYFDKFIREYKINSPEGNKPISY